MKKTGISRKTILGGLLVILIAAAVIVLCRPKTSFHGIHIQFEEDATAEQIEAVIERYAPDESFNDHPRYVRLTYFRKSERKVKELIGQICSEEGVRMAYHVLVAASALEYSQ